MSWNTYRQYLLVRYRHGEITRDQYFAAVALYVQDTVNRSEHGYPLFERRAYGAN